MWPTPNRRRCLAGVAAATLVLAGCRDEITTPGALDGSTASLAVVPGGSVSVEPGAVTLAPGESLQFAATALNAVGMPLPNRPNVQWSSS